MAHSQYQELPRPEKFNFVIDVIDYWANQPGNMTAMQWVSQDESQMQSLTFKYFSRQSNRIASLLENLGINEGDKMVMILPRVPAWWEIAVAAIRSGIVISPATTLLTSKDIMFRINKSAATVFVGDATSVQKVLAVRKECPNLRVVLQVGEVPIDGTVSFFSALENIGLNATVKPVRRNWNFPALVYFTSGTSGPPKMVQHNQVSWPLALTITGKFWHQLSPGKVFWNTAEQGWGKAAWSVFGAWNCGATLFVYDDRGPFDPRRLLGILHRYPVTTLCAAPLAYRQLVLQQIQVHYREFPPQALSHCTSAGEALNDEVIRQWQSLTGMPIHDGYGQTETVMLCGNFPGCEIRPGSMGKPAPTIPVQVIDANGFETATGEEGDIALLLSDAPGNNDFFGLFDGYVNDDGTLTRREKTFVHHGAQKTYYITGDKAKRDKDGYFWFVGRSDDVINSSGYRIGPFEVESTLKMHPAVVESAVVSSPDPARGEVVKAFVVLTAEHQHADQTTLRKELQDFCKAHSAPYKYPRKIQFVDGDFLPKTVSGKIQRNELKRLEWQRQGSSKL
ncbi:hypothetical protein BGZ60DRAFT_396739 [Tricladium varicosporioides]|nr:hypothetical protein BGZ60DRAFT_396739 [Hymenoscyphus varicosporioides]